MYSHRRTAPVALLSTLLCCTLPATAQRAESREADTDAADARAGAVVGGAAAADVEKAATAILERTNAFRSDRDCPAVKPNKELTAAARYFADYMARTGRYGHTADGNQPSGRAERHGYDFCLVSENIAYRYNSAGIATDDLAKGFTQGWIDSPGHRKNMLDPDVVDTGVAVARAESGVYYAVQMFGRPKSMQIEFKVSNRAGRAVAYKVGDQRYDLPPRVTRTHTRCRPAGLSFPGAGGSGDGGGTGAFKPRGGDAFVVTAGAGGTIDVRAERGGTAR